MPDVRASTPDDAPHAHRHPRRRARHARHARRRAQSGFALAALVTALTVLTACGDDGGSAAEGSLTLYSGRNEDLIAPLLERFTADTGIDVEARYGNTAQMAAQLLEEGDRSPADVFLAQDAGALGAVAKEGLFTRLPAASLDAVPAGFRSAGGEWVGVTARSRVLVYNADAVAETELPASVFELTEPRWSGRVGVVPTNASFQAFVTAMTVVHGEERTREFLAGLADNEPQIRDSNLAVLEEVDAGTLDIGLINHYYVGELAAERGVAPDRLDARLHFFPGGDIGALVNVAGVGILTTAADDPEAQAFVDYLLGPDAQTYFAEQTFEYPVVDGVAGPAGLPALAELTTPDVDLNDLDGLEGTIALIQASGLTP
ncbi:Extracellular solute-binding protein [Parafrankia sp. Ea1.12]|nr:iron ABC transporter substrate-binding protein [Parafrankia sp. Ea1.12]SQD97010.1 Extracellular solute-binding protein [Parafrankia sp. Ea1.12]